MRVFSLSIHADYACAHSGACCTAGWAIPVEVDRQPLLGAAVLVPGGDGVCRFFDRSTRLCRVHRDQGEAALPESCRHFPRLALMDERGVHVSLSHFCPTAARLLFRTDVPLAIVESPSGFPEHRQYEGLDARGTWPPLIRPSLLFDLDGYTAWERFVVHAFASERSAAALARIATAAEMLRAWSPGRGSISEVLDAATQGAADRTALERFDAFRTRPIDIVLAAVPESLRPPANRAPRGAHDDAIHAERSRDVWTADPVEHRGGARDDDDRVLCRYLAARAFASWTAYQSRGVRTLVADLVLADAVVRRLHASRSLLEAIREADRLLVHLVDRAALAARLGVLERRTRSISNP